MREVISSTLVFAAGCCLIGLNSFIPDNTASFGWACCIVGGSLAAYFYLTNKKWRR